MLTSKLQNRDYLIIKQVSNTYHECIQYPLPHTFHVILANRFSVFLSQLRLLLLILNYILSPL